MLSSVESAAESADVRDQLEVRTVDPIETLLAVMSNDSLTDKTQRHPVAFTDGGVLFPARYLF